jgi:hypothetical protein
VPGPSSPHPIDGEYVDHAGRYAQPDQTLLLSGEIPLVSRAARIADEKRRHGASPETMGRPATAQRSSTAAETAILHFTPAQPTR